MKDNPNFQNKKRGIEMFVCGWYNVKLLNKTGEVVESKEMYLTFPLYRREVMKMQTAFLQGKDVERLHATLVEKK